ncbi:M13 family metallopeptidase [Nocardia sp. NPDC052566]|uniref:M13 family metallopeptidase n=1 Tax=Nocardia sp. NPDC052566 TaxID=3364330 RepID=UPI0037C6C954
MIARDGNTDSATDNPRRLDRRRFLAVAAAVPVAIGLTACSASGGSAPARPAGPDLSGTDPAIRPQDDLFRHVNGAWLRDYQLPPDRSSYGGFDEVTDRTEERLHRILESLPADRPGTDEQRLRDLYDSFLDTATIDRLGIEPIADLLAEIDRATTKSDLARLMGVFATFGVTGLVRLEVRPDRHDSSRNLPYLVQAGLGLPDESYYREPQYAEVRTAYRTYLERMAQAAGLTRPAEVADRVLDLETKIAASQLDLVRLIESMSSYNRYGWAQLPELAPGFDWNAWRAGVTERPERFDTVLVDQPTYLTAVARLWADTDDSIWREYLRIMVFGRYAVALPKNVADAQFDCFEKALQGTKQPPERWRSAIRIVRERLGDALGRKYVAEHFPVEAKRQVEELVRDLLSAYRVRLANAEWMSEPTRTAAVAKVDKMIPLIGYPEHGRDYSALPIANGKLIAGLRAADQLEFRRQLGKLGAPVDRREWTMFTPIDVNANYSWELNHIVFPAAILQPPFFDPGAERAVNYGGIGMVIGHEIGHGFDSEGSKYDADGNLRDWWTPADKAAFAEVTKAVIAQYDGLVPAGMPADRHVNGELTVTENLADIRGMATTLAAYRIAEQRRGVTAPDFRPVFLACARMWRHLSSPEAAAMLLGVDSHSPPEFRVNQVVRNMPEFYTAFALQPTDKLFLSDNKRVTS